MFGGLFGGKGALSGEYEDGKEDERFRVVDYAPTENDIASMHWRLYEAKKKSDGTRASIFRMDRNKNESIKSTKIESAARCWQATKKLMIPHLLKFEAGICEDTSTTGEISIATQWVQPLEEWVQYSPQSSNDSRQLAWGVYCILKALTYLHGAGKCHGNISPRSIFITQSGDWKLWGLELCTHLEPTLDQHQDASLAFFRAHESRVDDAYRSPERCRRDWEAMAHHKVGASDIWALAKLLQVAYKNMSNGEIPRELAVWTKRMANPDPSKRPTAEQVLRGCPLFRQGFLRELTSLDELSATSMDEQVSFYEKLAEATKRDLDGIETTGALDEVLWRGSCVFKLLPKLAATLEIALASHFDEDTRRKVVKATLPLVVQVAAMLGGTSATGTISKDKEEPNNDQGELAEAHAEKLKAKLVAALEAVLVLKDADIRLQALRHMDRLAPLLKSEYVNKKLFEAVLLGFADDDDGHRLQTLMAMLQIAPKLSDKNRHDRLLRVVKRLEADRSAKIRTNVIIFYGKLAPDLPDALRLKAALPAFLKALEDPSSYVRLAAVRALGACRDHFTATVAAKGVIPHVAPLLLDPSGPVRDAASPCVDAFLSSARSEAEAMAQRDAERAKQKQEEAAAAAKKKQAEIQNATQTGIPPISSEAQAHDTVTPTDTPPKPPSADQLGAAATGWASWALGKVVDTAKHAVESEFIKPPTSKPEEATNNKKSADGWDEGWGDLDDDTEEPQPTKSAPAKQSGRDPKAERERKVAARKAEMEAKRQQKGARTQPVPATASNDDNDDFFNSFVEKAPAPAASNDAGGGWDDDLDLGDPEPPKPVVPKQSSKTSDTKTERERKLAARRAEMEAKRKQRAAAAATPAPAASQAANDGGGWDDDGWGDLENTPARPVTQASPPAASKGSDAKAERERKMAARRAEMEAKRQQKSRGKAAAKNDDFFDSFDAPQTATAAVPPTRSKPQSSRGGATLSLKKSAGKAPNRQQKQKNEKPPAATRLEIDESDNWDDF